ncbi:MAG: response regulator [Lachnospiraceae bacterium]|nr:response regulator [Lachnospiraceae bacterium]
MITAEKENFIVRVLIQKVKATGMDCVFVPWTVNAINSAWENTAAVTIFMDEASRPGNEVVHFLGEKLADTGKHLIVIGEKTDVQYVVDRVPGDHIFRTFLRPVDNAQYVEAAQELLKQVETGALRKCILIVDDDPNYMGLVREWLKGTYKVAMANSGLQAIKWLGKNKADLILLDHEMPVTSGPQVLEMLRSEEETRSIPVMFLTGKSDKESVMAVVALKPEGYFLKTIEREELLENLNRYFMLHK